MSYYQKHIFFCVNQKEPGKACCQNHNASAICDYAKKRIQDLNLWGQGKIRVSSSGCLGRCAVGPAVVVYPEGTFYTYSSTADIDKIIDRHLLKGEIVTELLLDKDNCRVD